MAQDRKELTTPNMVQAISAYQNNDYAEMARYLQAELSQNNKNGYAYSQLAYVYWLYDEYGDALTMSNLALQYLPKKDKTYLSFAYNTRAKVYYSLKDFANAEKDYSTAIKATPDEAKVYYERGDYYYQVAKYDLSDKDFQKVVSLAPDKTLGYMGLGRNALERNQYNDAVAQFNKAIQLQGSSESKPYSFRAECYIALGRFDEAASDIVMALDIDNDDKAYHEMFNLADSSLLSITSRLRVQKNKAPNDPRWNTYLANTYAHAKKYETAIALYKECIAKDGNPYYHDCISNCYRNQGKYTQALQYANQAVELDSSNINYRNHRAVIYYELNDMQSLINDYDYIIYHNPDNYFYYYRRGWYKSLMNDIDGAIEDCTASISLNPNYAYAYVTRGKLLKDKGETSAAKRDFRKCIELDTVDMSEMSCAFYAYFYMGDNKNALRLLDTLLSHNDDETYDAACLYSLMGNTKKALEYLRQTFENGYTGFTHIERDHDLDNIRHEKEFIEMVNKYKKKWQEETKEETPVAMTRSEEKTVEIPFIPRGAVKEVRCSINGLPLYFLFDTGASDVTISSVEAAFMFKNGYLTSKDVIGKNMYLTASGDVVEGTVINLNTIELGDLTLTNVRASVVKGQNAPLLLGQSVLNRLGKIEINNEKHTLKVTYQE